MIIITQPTATDAQIDHIVARIEEFGLRSQVMRGETRVVIGVIGPDELVREKPLGAIPGVESVVPVMKPYKLVAQENGSLPPPVSIGDVKIGSGQRVVLICGPCSVESQERLLSIANAVKKAGARVLRGGAFKPRTSPYSFQGLGEDGLRFLAEARDETGLPIITEIMDARDLATGGTIRRLPPNRRAQHAELFPPEGSRPKSSAGPAQARLQRDDQRPAHERRIHPERGQSATSSSANAASAPSKRRRATRSISTRSRS